jgi:hypothetical protein
MINLPHRACLWVVTCLAFAQSILRGATIVIPPSKDNTLYEDITGSLSNGQSDLYVGKTSENDGFHLRRGLIAFDLSQIPTGATIDSVSLSLFVSKMAPAASSVSVSLHVALQDWGEGASSGGGSGAPAAPGDATWLHRFHESALWTTPGGDYRQSASAITTVTTSDRSFTWVGGSLSGDVQAWVNNPSSNFGWFIRGVENINETAIKINSGESSANVPQLTVTYTIPEPSAAIALLGAAALIHSRSRVRRRRA